MECPNCRSLTQVSDSARSSEAVVRTRKCPNCSTSFRTTERMSYLSSNSSSYAKTTKFVVGWKAMCEIVHDTHVEKGFTNKTMNHGEQLMLMVSELAEGMEGVRKDRMDDKLPKRKQIEVELADTIIRIMNYATDTGLDVSGAVIEKDEYNKSRPYMHGGKKF